MEIILQWENKTNSLPVTVGTDPGCLTVYDGKLWGGASRINPSKRIINTTDGITWNIITDSAPWNYSTSLQLITSSSLNKMVVIGSEWPGYPINKVWSSSDGITWNLLTSTAPWTYRIYHSCVEANGKMMLMGGFHNVSGDSYLLNDVWYSTNGVDWFANTHSASWEARYSPISLYFDSKLWIMGGSKFPNLFYDVWWSSDYGVTWNLATDNAPWGEGGYDYGLAGGVVLDNKMWVFGTYGPYAYWSIDGVNWEIGGSEPTPPLYSATASYDDMAWIVGGNFIGTSAWAGTIDILSSSSSSKSSSSLSSSSLSSSSLSSSSLSSLSSSSSSSSTQQQTTSSSSIAVRKPKLCSLDLTNYSANIKDMNLSDVHVLGDSSSEIEDITLPPYSLVTNTTNGNPLVVFPTENNHIVIEEFDCLYETKITSKSLPEDFDSGYLFISHNEIGQIPFSFESLSAETNSSLLSFKYNTSFDEKNFFNPNNKNNVIYMPPNSKNEDNIIVPNSFNSTHLNTVGIEIWPDDMFEIENIKIGSLYNMSFSDFHVPKETYNLPSFSWVNNTYLFSECFSTLDANGNLTLFKYVSDKKQLVNEKTISCVLDSNSINYGFSNLLYSSQSGNILVATPVSILVINGTTLEIINVYHISNVNLYCCDNNGDFWGTIDNKNIIKIDSDLNSYTYGVVSQPKEMIFSNYHQLIFILSDNMLYTFNIATHEIKIIDQSDQYIFKDIDVYEDGSVAILLQNKTNNTVSIIKMFNPDLTIKKTFGISNEKVFQILYSQQGILFYLSEKDNKNCISYIDATGNVYSQTFDGANKDNNPMFLYYPQSKMFMIFSSNGNVFSCSDSIINGKLEIVKIYSSKQSFYKISYAARHIYSEKLNQLKVRVFVGSEIGQNDRWDSGEIESNKTEILYGGGNNLEAGQKYFVHISVYYENYGWSSVQIKDFITTK